MIFSEKLGESVKYLENTAILLTEDGMCGKINVDEKNKSRGWKIKWK